MSFRRLRAEDEQASAFALVLFVMVNVGSDRGERLALLGRVRFEVVQVTRSVPAAAFFDKQLEQAPDVVLATLLFVAPPVVVLALLSGPPDLQ